LLYAVRRRRNSYNTICSADDDRQQQYLLFLPVLGNSDDAAVVLVAPEVVLHARVHDVTHGDVHIVGAQVLQEIHHLHNTSFLNYQKAAATVRTATQ
jgi:hypothetical protein